VGENEVLRDEIEAYVQRLNEGGVQITATRYLGAIHDFVMLNAITNTPAVRGANKSSISSFKKGVI
jgi:acetyl esterase